MRTMKFTLAAVIGLMLISACNVTPNWTVGGQSTITVSGLTDADMRQYNTIGLEFANYSKLDTSLTPEQRTKDEQALSDWNKTGSTIEIYAHVAPRYVAYVNKDVKLTSTGKSARMDNVTSWKMVLEERKKSWR